MHLSKVYDNISYMEGGMETFINIFIPVVFCITITGFIFGILMAVSTKLRAKFMSKQIKATKYNEPSAQA